ncbi:DUF221-domain-containing protein [Meira miltonrushii]|uniref:DUF221-domain-containing protein n=1 Tax=Meira miltonrushii TaxID=1280837 RepID=A0A316V477_9BASI|nr:DUF221-domain-containing protein [Meira miltonrushii]PWN32359.1 DUF221-domain-containing protein [Meira miltonrushii]
MLGIAHALAEGSKRMVFAAYVGNVSSTDDERARLLDTSDQLPDPAAGITAPKNKPRPTMHVQSINQSKFDAITLLETRFRVYDEAVRRLRSKGSKPSFVGFVTFGDAMRAQVVAQSVHYPIPSYSKTSFAPEPRDIVWSNVSVPSNERHVRQLLVSALTIALFVFYIPPLTFLVSLPSPNIITKYLPGLYDLLRKNRRLEALVSTNLSSVVLIGLNALLPLILEWTAYLQGVLTDLAGNPMRIIDKLAQPLPQARHFSLSYVVFQSLAIIPLQLLQIPVTFGRAFSQLTAKTPRQHAELNAPPELYSGSMYPAALIIYTLHIWYTSTNSCSFSTDHTNQEVKHGLCHRYVALGSTALSNLPTFPLFGSQAIAIIKFDVAFDRFHVLVPALPIANIHRVERATLVPSAEIANAVANIGSTNDNSKKQQIDQQRNPIVALRAEALYGIDPDRHTDYKESPAAGYYYGILNTGRIRYGHSAVAGTLPDIRPPVCVDDDDEKDDNEQDQSVSQSDTAGLPADNSDRGSLTGVDSVLGRTRRQSRPHEAVVVSLRKRKSSLIPSSSLSNISVRNRKLLSQEAGGSGISGLPASTGTSTDVAGKSSLTFPQRKQRQPQDILDESCEEPEHQHEDPSQVWCASRSRLPSTAEQIEDEGQRIDEPQHLDTDTGDEDEEDESEETAGSYMHRNLRQTMPPGSFPWF